MSNATIKTNLATSFSGNPATKTAALDSKGEPLPERRIVIADRKSAMEVAKRIMRENEGVLAALAK